MGGTNSKPSPARRRCFLVSRPLQDGGKSGAELQWKVIGNQEPVPQLDQECAREPRLDETWNRNSPFTQHWAFCLLPPDTKVNSDRKRARAAFLEADYFDLGAESTQRATFSLIKESNSKACFSHSSTKWESSAVASISSLVEVGGTSKPVKWISKRGMYLIYSFQCSLASALVFD